MINRLFQQDQRRVYQQLNGKKKAAKILKKKKVGYFGATFEEQKKSHNKNAEWLKELRSERNEIKQGNIQITTKIVTYIGTYIST